LKSRIAIQALWSHWLGILRSLPYRIDLNIQHRPASPSIIQDTFQYPVPDAPIAYLFFLMPPIGDCLSCCAGTALVDPSANEHLAWSWGKNLVTSSMSWAMGPLQLWLYHVISYLYPFRTGHSYKSSQVAPKQRFSPHSLLLGAACMVNRQQKGLKGVRRSANHLKPARLSTEFSHHGDIFLVSMPIFKGRKALIPACAWFQARSCSSPCSQGWFPSTLLRSNGDTESSNLGVVSTSYMYI